MMSPNIVTFTSILAIVSSEVTVPGIERTYSDGVKSVGYQVVYGDEDMTLINEVVSDVEKSNALNSKVNLNEAITPLPAQDVKCLMSVDKHCSKEMKEMKDVLVQALKTDCAKCTIKEKEEAGKVVASLMAHDPVAWKLFLTRSALKIIPPKKNRKQDEIKFKLKGEAEIVNSKNKYTMPGFHVRVKRYAAEML